MRFCLGNGEYVECQRERIGFAGQRLGPKQLGLQADKEKDDEWLAGRSIAFPLAIFFAGVVVCSADDPNMGTWKLNEAKSKFSKGAGRNHTVVYEAAGDMVKVTVDGTDGNGQATHSEWTGKFDGAPITLKETLWQLLKPSRLKCYSHATLVLIADKHPKSVSERLGR